MTNVDCLDLLVQESGFFFKSEKREALELLLRGKDVCMCLSRLCKKGGSADNTRLLPHAKMLLAPMNCFLCRVEYALEENVLTEQR